MSSLRKCLSCHAVKDLAVEVLYPYEDGLTNEVPVPQLLVIDCQPEESGEYRAAIMCHDCWWKLWKGRGIDIWIGQHCWEWLEPKTPFNRLPLLKSDLPGDLRWNALTYEVVE